MFAGALQLGSLAPSLVGSGAVFGSPAGGFSLAGAPLFGKKKGQAQRSTIKVSAESGNPAQSCVGSDADSRTSEQLVDSRNDETLLADYLNGDLAAFPKLIGRYSDELLHFLTRFLGSRPAADDVFQET